MMISTENRVEIDLLRKIAKVFLSTKLSAASMSTVYNHYFNPMISSRSYMTVAPVDLYLDPIALRQGYVSVVNQAEVPNALHIQDSGMVPVCTEIAIVNPETRKICKEGEFGEIWVCSEANLTAFTNGPKGPVDHFAQTQFRGVIADGNPDVTYLRTGDLGFLYNVSITKNKSSNSNGGASGGGGGGGEADGEITTFQPLLFWEKLLIHLKLWDYIIFLLILKTLLNHVIQIFIEMDPVYLNVVIILLLFVNPNGQNILLHWYL